MNFLDDLLNTGLGIGKAAADKALGLTNPNTSNAKAVTGQPTDWGKLALWGGVAIGAVVLLVAIIRR